MRACGSRVALADPNRLLILSTISYRVALKCPASCYEESRALRLLRAMYRPGWLLTKRSVELNLR
jgi:hypothetical protein